MEALERTEKPAMDEPGHVVIRLNAYAEEAAADADQRTVRDLRSSESRG